MTTLCYYAYLIKQSLAESEKLQKKSLLAETLVSRGVIVFNVLDKIFFF